MSGDTIVALSTPPGGSALAVVRISGDRAAEIARVMAPRSSRWEPRTIHKTTISSGAGEALDEAAAVLYRAPGSYTGEDMLEIFCHGSMQVAGRIIEEAISLGARAAEPGEFTRRAFLEGRIDLSQAEAVADLIASETELQARVALDNLEGRLSREVGRIEEIILDRLAEAEASIDFSEAGEGPGPGDDRLEGVGEASGIISSLLESGAAGRMLRRGIRVTLTGPRNAGKSSLYNALLGEERALVSPVPGTTRDVLRERIHVRGFTFLLEDTAGLARTECTVESAGMEMGRKAAGAADLVLFVLDGSEGWTDEAQREYEAIRERNHMIVVNKSDLERPAGESLPGGDRTVATSAVTGEGLEGLRGKIFELTAGAGAGEDLGARAMVNARQGEALRRAKEALEDLAKGAGAGEPPEILSLYLREAAEACGEVTGRSVETKLLDRIFGRFCIGK